MSLDLISRAYSCLYQEWACVFSGLNYYETLNNKVSPGHTTFHKVLAIARLELSLFRFVWVTAFSDCSPRVLSIVFGTSLFLLQNEITTFFNC